MHYIRPLWAMSHWQGSFIAILDFFSMISASLWWKYCHGAKWFANKIYDCDYFDRFCDNFAIWFMHISGVTTKGKMVILINTWWFLLVQLSTEYDLWAGASLFTTLYVISICWWYSKNVIINVAPGTWFQKSNDNCIKSERSWLSGFTSRHHYGAQHSYLVWNLLLHTVWV